MMRKFKILQNQAGEAVDQCRHLIMGTDPKPQLHALALIELYQACKATKKGKKLHTSIGLARATRLHESIKKLDPEISLLLPKISNFVTHGEVPGHNDQHKSGLGIKSLRGILISHFVHPVDQERLIDYLSEEEPSNSKVLKSMSNYAAQWSQNATLLTTKTLLIKLITDYIKRQNQIHPGNTFGVDRAMDLAHAIGCSFTANGLKDKLFTFIREGKTASDYGFLNLFGWRNGASGADADSLRGIIINGLITSKAKREIFIKTLPGKTDVEIANAIDVNKEFWQVTPQQNNSLKF